MTKAALLLAMVSGFMLAAGAANAATLPKASHKDLPCATCHKGGDTTKKPTMDQCLACHGSYNDLAKRTEKLNPQFNPHLSHKGQEDCTSCHSMHGESHLICNDCHAFTGPGTQMK